MKKILSVLMTGAVCLTMTSCAPKFNPDTDITLKEVNGIIKTGEKQSDSVKVDSKVTFKAENNESNPLLTNIFCADPTSVEYNGRLYVYATCDNQQYLEKPKSDNTYEKIKSFVIMSTDDMVNWRYEGTIDTKSIAPWIIASWAPSVVSREEADGKTHFYLYFSNSGAGVGVLTATDPAGPWTDPLGEPLVSGRTEGLKNCPNPFDPGVCIDENGDGWLSFGGGVSPDGTDAMPGVSRIVKLGKDMISLDSQIAEIPAPYFFEASELNYINGTYVYTFNNSWKNRVEWDVSKYGEIKAPACSMAYMTTKTPLDKDSWVYEGYYLRNPGELEMEYSNNHTHLHKFKGEYYLFYHTLILQKERGITKGFRSVGVDKVEVDEKNVKIKVCDASRTGVSQIKPLNPYKIHRAETAFLTDTEYVTDENGEITVKCKTGDVLCVRGVDFNEVSQAFAAKVKGKGAIEVRLDNPDSKNVTRIDFECDDWNAVYNEVEIEDTHDVYFVMSGDFEFDSWQFVW